jgi:hypothetical protein
MKSVPAEKSSFKKLYTGIQRYALRYKFYFPLSENCQHFATGFYNYLTNQKIQYVNKSNMKSIPEEPFADLFTDESDDQYLEQVKKRRILANASEPNYLSPASVIGHGIKNVVNMLKSSE